MNEIDDNKKKPFGFEKAHGRRGGPEAAGRDNRSEMSQDDLLAIKADIPDRLPGEQDMETRVLLVDVDPWHAHAYWHVETAALERVAGGIVRDRSLVRLTLRIHDALCVGMSGFVPWPPLELEVSGLEGYRYVEIPDCGKDLIAELAAHGPGGDEVALAWSRPVRLPRAVMADPVSERVELVRIDEPGSPPRLVGRPSAECLEYLRPRPGEPQAAPLPGSAPGAGSSSFATQSWFWSAHLATGRTGGGND